MSPLSGEDRTVFPFDLTLVWPFRIDDKKAGSRRASPERVAVALLARGWTEIHDTLARGETAESERGFQYAEFVFLHGFVQKTMYGSYELGGRPFRLFTYPFPANDRRLVVEDEDKAWSATYLIRSLRLHVFHDGPALLVVELVAERPTTLAAAMNAISYLRTTHFQHYKQEDQEGKTIWVGGGAPQRVQVGPFGSLEVQRNRSEELEAALELRRPVLLRHWQSLLGALIGTGLSVEPLGDYRMAVMALLGTPSPETLTPDEWFALAEADGAGFMPYAEVFRDKELELSAYDRWWKAGADWGPYRDRIVAGQLTLVRVLPVTISSAEEGRAPEIPGYVTRIRKSWRNQYLQIFLLAHFQRAALMVLQERIADVANRIKTDGAGRLLDELEATQRDMAVFSSRYWFTDVSPQVQGQDIFRLLRRRIGSDDLYKGVIEDKALLANWVMANEERRRAKYWDLLNQWVIPIGLGLTAAGAVAGPLVKGWRLFSIWSFPAVAVWVTNEHSREAVGVLLVTTGLCVVAYYIAKLVKLCLSKRRNRK